MSDKLPHFESLDELVEFWETHDFTDYMDQMEEVDLDSLPTQPATLPIKLDPEPLAKLTQIAVRRGVTPSSLIQSWIEERLAQEPV